MTDLTGVPGDRAAGKQPLLVLIGPTAVGKTALSLSIARSWNAEIISGDSMQVYRTMDIGTAKIKEDERQGVPHHLIDIRAPEEAYSAADFQAEASSSIADIASRGKLPFVVGGTGLYVESLCYNYQFADRGSDEVFRTEMEAYAERNGAEALHRKLAEVDPIAAERLHPNDIRRVIRALEVHHTTGQSFSEQQAGQKKESPYNLVLIGLTMDRAELYRRIELRIDEMLKEGLVEEVERLLARNLPPHAVPMQALGYKEIARYLRGECSYEAAVELLKRDTRRFAKRQLSWFRHMQDIHWFDMGENFHNHLRSIHAIIAGKFQDHLEYTSNQSFLDGGNVQ
ncbi:tRNA (adenosine(37)-N6)-dimethylallyltransferase MiaA [Paenibacillus sp. 1011MAR3C5]|uniref:tRNA (adenosine(37)-N6)-dimethylallyltransferase MiaA n=1 Tax=Paenibacillus sp. 1011MAR3C5 TaxID=1675787 RepID=UPI000E6BAD2C|nr:tRNA (adenosine(37)-N6)-dimethylallyltransferase MiaA [Paenibacillus sp. 1011MAR3C5]RJE90154.1 tRNA (adenosine(37)-N6)-dimethylallyltransferase MiaA [Paenibacillus sp. 1011MAR3C5]